MKPEEAVELFPELAEWGLPLGELPGHVPEGMALAHAYQRLHDRKGV